MEKSKIEQLIGDVITVQTKLDEMINRIVEYGKEFGVSFVQYPYKQSGKKLHVYEGIEKLGKILGCEVIVEPRCDSEYPYLLSFVHGDITYFQIQEENPNLKEEKS